MAQAAASSLAGKATSHRRALPPPAVASVLPSGLNAAAAGVLPPAARAPEEPSLISAPTRRWLATLHSAAVPFAPTVARVLPSGLNASAPWPARSEERRVGKECRARWSP